MFTEAHTWKNIDQREETFSTKTAMLPGARSNRWFTSTTWVRATFGFGFEVEIEISWKLAGLRWASGAAGRVEGEYVYILKFVRDRSK
jgi:hypothetical protein